MAKGDWTLESLKEHYDTILADRKLLDDARFKAVEDKFVNSDKAITKAETAQQQYNVVHNDLSRKNELMQTRIEAEKDAKNFTDQVNSLHSQMDEKFRLVFDAIKPFQSGLDSEKGKESAISKYSGWIAFVIMLIGFLIVVYNTLPHK